MPKGFIITKWTEDKGLVVQIKYPESIVVDLDDMMRVFYAHITGAGEAGNVLVRLEKAKASVASHFTGMESPNPYMINLMLELGEDPEMYGEAVIKKINERIIKFLRRIEQNPPDVAQVVKKLSEYLKESLFLLERLENLSKEQKMAQIYTSEKGRTILEILHERAISRQQLQGLLEERLNKIVSNLDITLDPFIKTDLVRQDWIEGSSEIVLFLQNDFTIFRSVPEKLIEAAKNGSPSELLAQRYIEVEQKFFENYSPNFEDNLRIARNLMNPDKYDYLVLFREKPYPLNKIPKGPGESFERISSFLKEMEEDKIITVLEDKKGTKWVFLLSDIMVEKFFPEYLIEQIRKDRMEKKITKDIAIKHLNILENAYTKG